jgi:hypothetical protein
MVGESGEKGKGDAGVDKKDAQTPTERREERPNSVASDNRIVSGVRLFGSADGTSM